MTEEECRQFENDLMYATRETLVRKKEQLTVSNYKNMLKTILESILLDNEYNVITNNNGARDLIRKYNNISILEVIALRFSGGENIDLKVVDDISRDITSSVESYVEKILVHRITEDWLSPYELEYDDSIEGKISKAHFKTPTNACRDAVLNNKQVCVSRTSISLCGMHAFSDVGKVAKNQEDSYYIGVHPGNEDFKIMLVADGMGGESNGEKASNYTTKKIIEWFEALPASEFNNSNNTMIKGSLEREIRNIHSYLRESFPKSGTTLCMFIVKQNNVFICNVGDSKGYILENGKSVYSTVAENSSTECNIPDDFARFFYFNYVLTNSIGRSKEPVINCDSYRLHKGRKYNLVLCSDGVTDYLSNKQIKAIISRPEIDDIARDLVLRALNTTSSFADEYNSHFGSIINSMTNAGLKKKLFKYDIEEAYKKVVVGGGDNATAIAGSIHR